MTGALPPDDPSLFDQLVTQTDNGPDTDTLDPDQSPDWRPPAEVVEVNE